MAYDKAVDSAVLDSKLLAIANAIRKKAGTSDPIYFDNMPMAIDEIQSGSATEPYVEEVYDSSGYLIDANMVGYTKLRNYQFYNCSKLALISLPSGLTSIGNHAFINCSNLAITSLPSGLTSIGDYAFTNCKGLTSITFEGKPMSIFATAFQNCPNLTTINVPWAEGEVSNAPWGATNATINYNYTA